MLLQKLIQSTLEGISKDEQNQLARSIHQLAPKWAHLLTPHNNFQQDIAWTLRIHQLRYNSSLPSMVHSPLLYKPLNRFRKSLQSRQ